MIEDYSGQTKDIEKGVIVDEDFGADDPKAFLPPKWQKPRSTGLHPSSGGTIAPRGRISPNSGGYEALEGWQKRSFEIMTAQALNLAIEQPIKEKDEMESARYYFQLLLRLRNDKALQELFIRNGKHILPLAQAKGGVIYCKECHGRCDRSGCDCTRCGTKEATEPRGWEESNKEKI